ncbi:MAG TPA: exodeoxyribonuclease III [Candidatus Thalassarchaeaceae archaeon]|nr:exodeoxyribonuclease III [Candidatus Thalassarchaeaceae archaeon]
MRIVSWNLNGIRAAIRKGLDEFIDLLDADIWMFQEVRAFPEQLPKDWKSPEGFDLAWHPAEKKGYSGVSTWSKIGMNVIGTGMGRGDDPMDLEGRILTTEHSGIRCINTYLPSGSARNDRQVFKERWMEDWLDWLSPNLSTDTPVIVVGDLNIAHQEIDIWNARSNQMTSGFLPQEREWFNRLLGTGWHDLCRQDWGDTQGPYSWWSNRGRAREEDKGWRIDYILGNDAARESFQNAKIVRAGGLQVSDHAPVVADFKL